MLLRVYFLFLSILLLMLSGCKSIVKPAAIPVENCGELTVRTYRLHEDQTLSPLYYSIKNNGELDIYKCRFMNSAGNCYYSDSSMIAWICNTNRIEEYNRSNYNLRDSLSFPYSGYRAFFREPYRFQRLMRTGRKDTVFTQYGNLLKHDSIVMDNKGFKTYQQAILDSFYIAGERIFVFKVFVLKEDREKDIVRLYPDATYHVSERFLLYYEARLANTGIYVPVQEFIEEKKVACPCGDAANKNQ